MTHMASKLICGLFAELRIVKNGLVYGKHSPTECCQSVSPSFVVACIFM